MKDYHTILGVSSGTSFDEISKAYKRRLKVLHPDRFDPKTQQEEWQQANRMLQELNEAYNYFKKQNESSSSSGTSENQNSTHSSSSSQSHTDDSSSKRSESRQSEQFQASQNAEANNSRHAMPPDRGIVNSPINGLGLGQISFIKGLIADKNSVKIPTFSYVFNYGGIGVGLYFYTTNISSWMKLGTVTHDSFLGGLILLFALSALISYTGLNIYRFHTAKIRPGYIFSPLYFIKVTFDKVMFAYAWNIRNINYYKNKYTSDLHINVSDHIEKFRVPFTFSYDSFSADYRAVEQRRSEMTWEWFANNDILRFLNNEPVKKPYKHFAIGYLVPAAFTIFFCFVLGDKLTIIDNQAPARARIENYAKREEQQSTTPLTPPVAVDPNKFKTAVPFGHSEVPLPPTGKILSSSGGPGLAPLKIKVPAGNDHYYVKVVDQYSNKTIRSFFIRAGETAKVNVPLGNCKVKYAYGTKWYGKKYLFGPETFVFMADSDFNFRQENNGYAGFTVELIPQVNGNLHERSISVDEF